MVGGTTAGASSPPRGALSSEVTVVDDGESSPLRSPQTSPAKKVAQVLCAAARKPKRVGPVTRTALVEARRKKRKPGTPVAPALPEATTSERQPPARTQLDTAAALPSASTASPAPPCPAESPANGKNDAISAAAPAAAGSPVPPAATGGAGDEERPRAPAPLPVVRVTAPVRLAPEPAARAAFDLEVFCRAYNPAERVTTPPSFSMRLSLAEKVDKLVEVFGELRRSLQPAPDGASSMAMLSRSPAAVLPGPAGAARPSTPDAGLLRLDRPITWTLPLLGAAAVCHLRCSSIEVPRAKVKGEYYPPQVHQLAAHRFFRDLGSDEARPPPGRRDSHVSKPSRGAYPRRALRSCPSTSAARSRGTAMVARRACGSWPAVCVTGAAPTDAPTTSARTAGRAACPGSFKGSSFATTARTAATRTTASADEEAEVLPVRRFSSIANVNTVILGHANEHTPFPAGPLLWPALRFRSVSTCSGTPRTPMVLALTSSRPMALTLPFRPSALPGSAPANPGRQVHAPRYIPTHLRPLH
ncbi:hypothetical protein PHYSODRAFT_295825 [Phytophthora sojae]|uniref:Uncharacterized protein n=1 Tax=Phytophthora sojae (strain P6497) TaxID=1094619 RepID=G4Z0Z5_PHYSP|nr:hypothetical protein PHYSODRAFT_295825 [Phytophthora sojae]EGZ23420.1 hypothetical protein PHYSODRAFT_295825 [Phytophthora sojae]|eukprot:XP_009518708.1 hypothetical protein PHYSODRAFT_295825 [Phytophthora sojae]